MVWLTGGALAIALVMIVGLLALVRVPGRAHVLAAAGRARRRRSTASVLMGEVDRRRDATGPTPAVLDALLEGRAAERARGASSPTRGTVRRAHAAHRQLRAHAARTSTGSATPRSPASERPQWALVVERLDVGPLLRLARRLPASTARAVADGAEREVWKPLRSSYHDERRATRWRQRARARDATTSARVNARVEARRGLRRARGRAASTARTRPR